MICKYFIIKCSIINIKVIFTIYIKLYKGIKYNILELFIFSEVIIILMYIIFNIINIINRIGV